MVKTASTPQPAQRGGEDIRAGTIQLRRLVAYIGKAIVMTVVIFPARLRMRNLISGSEYSSSQEMQLNERGYLGQGSSGEYHLVAVSPVRMNGQGFLPQRTEARV
jgi:hypothetical protein